MRREVFLVLTPRRRIVRQARPSATRSGVTPFTLFEARSINFAIVVYFVFKHVGSTCIEPTLGPPEGTMAKKAKKAKKKTGKKKKK
jgi:hypothetical protein